MEAKYRGLAVLWTHARYQYFRYIKKHKKLRIHILFDKKKPVGEGTAA
jgi:hypothetical protein